MRMLALFVSLQEIILSDELLNWVGIHRVMHEKYFAFFVTFPHFASFHESAPRASSWKPVTPAFLHNATIRTTDTGIIHSTGIVLTVFRWKSVFSKFFYMVISQIWREWVVFSVPSLVRVLFAIWILSGT